RHRGATREVLHLRKQQIREFAGAQRRVFLDGGSQPRYAVKPSFRIRGLGQTVGMKHEDISWIQNHRPFVENYIVVQSDRKSFQLQLLAATRLQKERLSLAGIRHT